MDSLAPNPTPPPSDPTLEAARSVLMSQGWQEVIDPATCTLMNRLKDYVVAGVAPDPPYSTWTLDRLSGFILGLGYIRNHWSQRLERYDRTRLAQSTLAPDQPKGHPYSDSGGGESSLDT